MSCYILSQRQVLGATGEQCWVLVLHQAHTDLCCPLISAGMMESIYSTEDGESIYAPYFKHLTAAVIRHPITALLKASCARTGTSTIHQPGGTENNRETKLLLGFLKLVSLVRSTCSQREKHHNINWQLPWTALLWEKSVSNSIIWYHCGISWELCRGRS